MKVTKDVMMNQSSCKSPYLIIFLLLLSVGCDRLYSFDITNMTNNDLAVKIKFNENYINEYKFGDKSIEQILKLDLYNVEIESFDTINYEITAKLKPKESLSLVQRLHAKPSLSSIDKVEIEEKNQSIFEAGNATLNTLYNKSDVILIK